MDRNVIKSVYSTNIPFRFLIFFCYFIETNVTKYYHEYRSQRLAVSCCLSKI